MSKVLKQWDHLHELIGKLKKNRNSNDAAEKVLDASAKCLRNLKGKNVDIEGLIEALFLILESSRLSEHHDKTFKMLTRQCFWDQPTARPAFHNGLEKIQPSWTGTDVKLGNLLVQFRSNVPTPTIDWYRLTILLTTHETKKIHNDACSQLHSVERLEATSRTASLMGSLTSSGLLKRLKDRSEEGNAALKEMLEENIPIYLTVIRPSMSRDSKFLNHLLQIIKKGFEHSDQNLRISAFVSWGQFIILLQHFGAREIERRIDLIVKPMKKTLKNADVIESSLKAFWPLVIFLGKKLLNDTYFKKVLIPLMKKCFGSSPSSQGKKLAKSKQVMEERLNTIASEVVAHLTVPSEQVERHFTTNQLLESLTSPVIEFDDLSGDALESLLPLFQRVFVQSVHSTRGHSAILLGMWQLFMTKIFENLQNADKPTQQDGALFRKLLETIDTINEVDRNIVSPSFLFKLIAMFEECPNKIMNNSRYDHSKEGEALLLRRTPIIHLLSILFSKPIVRHDAPEFHHLWVDLVQHWIDVGLSSGNDDTQMDFVSQLLSSISMYRDHLKYLLVWNILANHINQHKETFVPSTEVPEDEDYYHLCRQLFTFPLFLPQLIIAPPSEADGEDEASQHATAIADCQQYYGELYEHVTTVLPHNEVIKLQADLFSNARMKEALRDTTVEDGSFAFYLSLYRPITNAMATHFHDLFDKNSKHMMKQLSRSIFSPQDGDDRFFQIGMFCLYQVVINIDDKENFVFFLTRFHQQVVRGSNEQFVKKLAENGCEEDLHEILRHKISHFEIDLKNVKVLSQNKESWENFLTCIQSHLIKYPDEEKDELVAQISNGTKEEYSELMQTPQDTEHSAATVDEHDPNSSYQMSEKIEKKLNSSVTKRRKRKVKALPPPSPPQQPSHMDDDEVMVVEHDDVTTSSPISDEKNDVEVAAITDDVTNNSDDVTVATTSPSTDNNDVTVSNNSDFTLPPVAAAEKDDAEVAAAAATENGDVTEDDVTVTTPAAPANDVELSPVLNITKRRKRKSTRTSRATKARKRRLMEKSSTSAESESTEAHTSSQANTAAHTSSQVVETSPELPETSAATELSTEASESVKETSPEAAEAVTEAVELGEETPAEGEESSVPEVELTEATVKVEPESVEAPAPQSPESSPGVELPTPPTPEKTAVLPVVPSHSSDDDMPLSYLNHNKKKRQQTQTNKKAAKKRKYVVITTTDTEDDDKSLSQVRDDIRSASLSPSMRPLASNLDENLHVDDDDEESPPAPDCNLDSSSLDEDDLVSDAKVEAVDADKSLKVDEDLEEPQDLKKDAAEETAQDVAQEEEEHLEDAQDVTEDFEDTQDLEEDPEETQDLEEDPEETQDLEEDLEETQDLEEDPEETQDLEEDPEKTQGLKDDPEETQDLEEDPEEAQDLEEDPEETQDLEKDDVGATQEEKEDLEDAQVVEATQEPNEDLKETQELKEDLEEKVEQSVDVTHEEKEYLEDAQDLDATQELKEDSELTTDTKKENLEETQQVEKEGCSDDEEKVSAAQAAHNEQEIDLTSVQDEEDKQETDTDVSMGAQIDNDSIREDLVVTEEEVEKIATEERVESPVEDDKKVAAESEETTMCIDLTGDDDDDEMGTDGLLQDEDEKAPPTVDTSAEDLDISDIPTEETGMETSVSSDQEDHEEEVVSTKEANVVETCEAKVASSTVIQVTLNSTFDVSVDKSKSNAKAEDDVETTDVSSASQTADVSTDAQTTDVSTDAQTTDVSTEAQTTDMSTEAETTNVSTEAQTTEVSTDDQTTEVSTDDHTTDTTYDPATDTTTDKSTDDVSTMDRSTDTSEDLVTELNNTEEQVMEESSSNKESTSAGTASSSTESTSAAVVTSQLPTDVCSSPISNRSTTMLQPMHSSPVVTGIPMRSCSLTYPKKSLLKRTSLFGERDSPSPKKTKGVTFNSSFDKTKEYVRDNSDTPMRPTSCAVLRKNSPRRNRQSSSSRELVFSSRGEQMVGRALANRGITSSGNGSGVEPLTAGKRMVAAAQAAKSEDKKQQLLNAMKKTHDMRQQLRATFDTKYLESMSASDLVQVLTVVHPTCAVAKALHKKFTKNSSS